jgi:hypothetical protein
MFYARSRHAFSDQRLERHRYQTMFDFIMRTIGNARPAAPPTSQ